MIEYPVGAQCLLLAAAVVAGADQELAGLGQVQVQVHAQVQGARNATGKSHQSLVRQRNARKETLRSTCFVRSTTQVTLYVRYLVSYSTAVQALVKKGEENVGKKRRDARRPARRPCRTLLVSSSCPARATQLRCSRLREPSPRHTRTMPAARIESRHLSLLAEP